MLQSAENLILGCLNIHDNIKISKQDIQMRSVVLRISIESDLLYPTLPDTGQRPLYVPHMIGQRTISERASKTCFLDFLCVLHEDEDTSFKAGISY